MACIGNVRPTESGAHDRLYGSTLLRFELVDEGPCITLVDTAAISAYGFSIESEMPLPRRTPTVQSPHAYTPCPPQSLVHRLGVS